MPSTSRTIGNCTSNARLPPRAHRLRGGDLFGVESELRIYQFDEKGSRFKYLEEFGCDLLVRKHDIEIPLEEYELDLQRSKRWRTYAERHEELWIDFTEEAVRRAGTTDLLDTDGLSKHEFADELKELG